MTVFCDWLNVTCSPEDSFTHGLYHWLVLHYPLSFEELSDDRIDKAVFDVGRGKIIVEEKHRFHKAQASGSAIAQLRDDERWLGYLAALATAPHKVTRLDAALDLSTDAPIVLRSLEQKYDDDHVALTQKPLRVTRVYQKRSDGQLTGTWYAGKRSKARVTARVYDKQHEAFENRGEVLPPTTRVELVFTKDLGCTLRDAYMPAPLFHQYASPKLVPKPDDVPDWEPHGESWSISVIDTDPTIEKYRRRVELSPDVSALAKLAARLGVNAEEIAVRIFRERFRAHLQEQEERASESA